MKLIPALVALLLAGCNERDPRRVEFDQYRAQRMVVKICHDGTRIWKWNGKLYTSDRRQWPDGIVDDAQPDLICN